MLFLNLCKVHQVFIKIIWPNDEEKGNILLKVSLLQTWPRLNIKKFKYTKSFAHKKPFKKVQVEMKVNTSA